MKALTRSPGSGMENSPPEYTKTAMEQRRPRRIGRSQFKYGRFGVISVSPAKLLPDIVTCRLRLLLPV